MKMSNVLSYLDELFPNPRCELNYNKDYELLLAVMLSAQTTDKRVNQVTEVLFKKYPTIESLAESDINDIEKIIKPIGTYKKKSQFIKSIANTLVKDSRSIIPNDRKYLETLSGVGRKTINVFLAEYYKVPAIAVDTHVERVSKRLNLVKSNSNVIEIEQTLMKRIPKDKWIKAHHQFIFFGRYHCKAIKPNCSCCKLSHLCKDYKEKGSDNND